MNYGCNNKKRIQVLKNMKIKRIVYDKIITQVNETPPEIGGILGAIKGEVVAAEFDKCKMEQKMCNYTPNVNYLNNMIDTWEKNNINFCGIFTVIILE